MLGALIVFMGIMIVLALVTDRIATMRSWGEIHYVTRSESPVMFWMMISAWACALGVAVWTALGRKFY
jgi:hypothetical protein